MLEGLQRLHAERRWSDRMSRSTRSDLVSDSPHCALRFRAIAIDVFGRFEPQERTDGRHPVPLSAASALPALPVERRHRRPPFASPFTRSHVYRYGTCRVVPRRPIPSSTSGFRHLRIERRRAKRRACRARRPSTSCMAPTTILRVRISAAIFGNAMPRVTFVLVAHDSREAMHGLFEAMNDVLCHRARLRLTHRPHTRSSRRNWIDP
jgi:hypothetical protein